MATQTLKGLVGRLVTLVTCDGLIVFSRCLNEGGHVDLAYEQMNIEKGGDIGDKRLVSVGLCAANTMVDVEYCDGADDVTRRELTTEVCQCRGVAASGYHQKNRTLRGGKVALLDGLLQAVDHRLCELLRCLHWGLLRSSL